MNPDMNPDSNWAKILDPDQNSMYLDPQHWLHLNSNIYTNLGAESIRSMFRKF